VLINGDETKAATSSLLQRLDVTAADTGKTSAAVNRLVSMHLYYSQRQRYKLAVFKLQEEIRTYRQNTNNHKNLHNSRCQTV